MNARTAPIPRLLLGAGAIAAMLPAVASAAQGTGSLQGLVFSEVVPNILLAASIVLLFVFGLYAYASLARFAPYHSWIYLYLVSLTGIAWASFLIVSGLSMAYSVFIITTVVGINLIVHILRFDRIDMPSPFRAPIAPARG